MAKSWKINAEKRGHPVTMYKKGP